MNNSFTIYDNLSTSLGTATILDHNLKEYYLFAKEQSDVLRELGLVNKKRIREGNELLKQFDVNLIN